MPAGEPDPSEETYYVGLPTFPVAQNGLFYGGRQEMHESAMRLEPNRYHEP